MRKARPRPWWQCPRGTLWGACARRGMPRSHAEPGRKGRQPALPERARNELTRQSFRDRPATMVSRARDSLAACGKRNVVAGPSSIGVRRRAAGRARVQIRCNDMRAQLGARSLAPAGCDGCARNDCVATGGCGTEPPGAAPGTGVTILRRGLALAPCHPAHSAPCPRRRPPSPVSMFVTSWLTTPAQAATGMSVTDSDEIRDAWENKLKVSPVRASETGPPAPSGTHL